jgi:hypothetical protein
MRQITGLLNKHYLNLNHQENNYLNYFLQQLSNTTIFFQYDTETFLSFKVYEASQGVLVYLRSGEIALQCQIQGTTYTLTQEHMIQIGNRERHELFNQLGVNGSQFLRD